MFPFGVIIEEIRNLSGLIRSGWEIYRFMPGSFKSLASQIILVAPTSGMFESSGVLAKTFRS